MSKATERRTTCYIASPPGQYTEVLRDVLELNGITWNDNTTLAPTLLLSDAILNSIRDSEFVCAVLPQGVPADNVLVELGIAIGAGKPLFLLREPGAVMPFDIRGSFTTTTKSSDRAVLEHQLRSFLDRTKIRRSGSTPGLHHTRHRTIDSLRPTAVDWVQAELPKLRSAKALDRAAGLSAIVEKLLVSAGAIVAARSLANDGRPEPGPDVAVWINELQAYFGNPLVIEIKAGALTRESLLSAQEAIVKFAEQAGSRGGLLIYWDFDGRVFKLPQKLPIAIIPMSLDSFLAAMHEGTLSEQLIRARNRLYHGSGDPI